jgi:hypothetical protein
VAGDKRLHLVLIHHAPKNTAGSLTQSGTFGGQPTFTTTPGTTVDDITGDITNPDGSYGGNLTMKLH